MKLVIPMTGYGTRFVNAGYTDLKPLIRIYGKPIIQWIVEGMYPGEKDILFICRKEHLDSIEGMKECLLRIAPSAGIFVVEDSIKKGPVYDVLRASELIDDEEPVMINYCDFYMTWDWKDFSRQLKERDPDGCVPCYTGFHPHLMIPKNLYASCRTDENDDLIEIREKYSFEEDKTKAKHSPGNYYYKNGRYLKKYCRALIDAKDELKGEYYASLPYNYMVRDGLKVWIPTCIKYFCQWGTPEDMEESLYWIDMMRRMNK